MMYAPSTAPATGRSAAASDGRRASSPVRPGRRQRSRRHRDGVGGVRDRRRQPPRDRDRERQQRAPPPPRSPPRRARGAEDAVRPTRPIMTRSARQFGQRNLERAMSLSRRSRASCLRRSPRLTAVHLDRRTIGARPLEPSCAGSEPGAGIRPDLERRDRDPRGCGSPVSRALTGHTKISVRALRGGGRTRRERPPLTAQRPGHSAAASAPTRRRRRPRTLDEPT